VHGVSSSAAHLSADDRAALNAGRYGPAVAVMREMGWSWPDLCAAPFDLVQEIIIRLGAENEALDKKDKLRAGESHR